jgi:hypothetical protein
VASVDVGKIGETQAKQTSSYTVARPTSSVYQPEFLLSYFEPTHTDRLKTSCTRKELARKIANVEGTTRVWSIRLRCFGVITRRPEGALGKRRWTAREVIAAETLFNNPGIRAVVARGSMTGVKSEEKKT